MLNVRITLLLLKNQNGQNNNFKIYNKYKRNIIFRHLYSHKSRTLLHNKKSKENEKNILNKKLTL